jgi:hypothetical protein
MPKLTGQGLGALNEFLRFYGKFIKTHLRLLCVFQPIGAKATGS